MRLFKKIGRKVDKVFTGNFVKQLVFWFALFGSFYLFSYIFSSLSSNELFHSMTSYDYEGETENIELNINEKDSLSSLKTDSITNTKQDSICSQAIAKFVPDSNENKKQSNSILRLKINEATSIIINKVKEISHKAKSGRLDLWKKALYMVGVIFFSGLLVMIFTNALRNRINKIERGDVCYYFRNHILIFGYSDMLLGYIKACLENKRIDVVVIVEKDVVKTREIIEGAIGKSEHLFVLHGSRMLTKDLQNANVAKAEVIFLIGENEENSDLNNLQSLNLICSLLPESESNCKMIYVLDKDGNNYLSKENMVKLLPENLFKKSVLKVFNFDEICANAIVYDIYEKYGNENDYSKRNGNDYIFKRNNSILNYKSEKYSHVVVLGVNKLANYLMKALVNVSHYPNHIKFSMNENGKFVEELTGLNTKITIMDEGIDNVKQVIHWFENYINLCKYEIKSLRDGELITLEKHDGNKEQTYIDIDFELIDTSIKNNRHLIDKIADWSNDEKQMLSIFTCLDDFGLCYQITTSLSDKLENCSVPIWMYTKNNVRLHNLLKNNYTNIITWGNPNELNAFGNWTKDTTFRVCDYLHKKRCAVLDNVHRIDMYNYVYNYVSYIPTLHQLPISPNKKSGNDDEYDNDMNALLRCEYNRCCAENLLCGRDKLCNFLIHDDLIEKNSEGFLYSDYKNFKNQSPVIKEYYKQMFSKVGKKLYNGEPIV